MYSGDIALGMFVTTGSVLIEKQKILVYSGIITISPCIPLQTIPGSPSS